MAAGGDSTSTEALSAPAIKHIRQAALRPATEALLVRHMHAKWQLGTFIGLTVGMGIIVFAVLWGLRGVAHGASVLPPLAAVCAFIYWRCPYRSLMRAQGDLIAASWQHDTRCDAFNARLDSVKSYAAVPGTQEPPSEVVKKFTEQRASLECISDRLEEVLNHRNRLTAHARMQREIESTLGVTSPDLTRDLSDLVYVNEEQRSIEASAGKNVIIDDPMVADALRQLEQNQ